MAKVKTKKQPEPKQLPTISVSSKSDPRLKAYQDSLYVRTQSSQKFEPGSKIRPLTKQEQQYWKDKKTGLFPNVVEYVPRQKYYGHFKKPIQPIEYKEPIKYKTADINIVNSKTGEKILPSFIYSDEAKSKTWKKNSMKGFSEKELPNIEASYDMEHNESYWLKQPGAKGNIEIRYSDGGHGILGEKYVPKDKPGPTDDVKGGWREWHKNKYQEQYK